MISNNIQNVNSPYDLSFLITRDLYWINGSVLTTSTYAKSINQTIGLKSIDTFPGGV